MKSVNVNNYIGTSYSIEGIKITVKEKSGESEYGTIFLCLDAADAKHTIRMLQSQDDEVQHRIMNEINIQKALSSHPNIVKLEGFVAMDKSFKVLTEHCEGSLFSEFSKVLSVGFPTNKIVEIFSSVLSAIKYMHEQMPPIFHRDIKMENVVCKNGVWKISEFSSCTSKVYRDMMNDAERSQARDDIQRYTNPCNRAPEMVDFQNGVPITEKVDTWNLGCFLYKLCTFKDAFPRGLTAQILNGTYQWKQTWKVDEYLQKVVGFCLQVDPTKRPTIDQLDAEFRKHYGISEVSLAKKVKKSDKMTIEEYTNDLIKLMPKYSHDNPNGATNLSDESDIEMDEEAELVKDAIFEKLDIDMTEFEHLFDESDEESSVSTNSTNDSSKSKPQIVEISDTSDFLIEFTDERSCEFSESSENASVASSTGGSSNPDELVNLMRTSPTVLKKKLYSYDEASLKSALTDLSTAKGYSEFILSFIRESGSKGPHILSIMSSFDGEQINGIGGYINIRKEFSREFPMFEGNFSLSDFIRKNKSSPPKPGDPPVSIEVIKNILNIFEVFLKVFSKSPVQVLADDIADLYQLTLYITAKLRQFKIDTEFIESTAIKKLAVYQSMILSALQKSKLRVLYPTEPFDFNNLSFVAKLRAPKHRNVYE